MNRKRFLWLFAAMAVCIITFTACDGDDDDDENYNPDDIENPGTGGNGGGGTTQKNYTLSQLQGHWVVENEWELYTNRIKDIESNSYSKISPSAYLDDNVLNMYGGVTGYYIKDDTAYEVYFTVTDTKYANNPDEGNTIAKSWYYPNTTVYFMNTSGGKWSHVCSITDNELTIGYGNYFTVLNTSSFRGSDGTVYKKVNVKNF